MQMLDLHFEAHRTLSLEGFTVEESLFRFDINKYAVLTVAADDGVDLENTGIHSRGQWKPAEMDQLFQRTRDLEAELLKNDVRAEGLLHVVVVQGIGRDFFVSRSADEPTSLSTVSVTCDGESLETISRLECGDDLALWRLGQAASGFRQTTRIIGGGLLDTYAIYRGHGGGFYLSDDTHPTVVYTLAAGASLKYEALSRHDPHYVQLTDGHQSSEFVRRHADPAVPIYEETGTSGRLRLLVELVPMPIWIESGRIPDDSRYGGLYYDIADCLAYWLWQADKLLLKLLENYDTPFAELVIHLTIEEGEGWFEAAGLAETEPTECVQTEWVQEALRADLGFGFAELLAQESNAGERLLLEEVLQAICRLPDHLGSTNEAVKCELDEICSPPDKRRIVYAPTVVAPQMDRTGLPEYRRIQPFEDQRIFDSIGEFLSGPRGLTPGTIAAGKRTDTLNSVVGMLYHELQDEVARLSPTGLVEWLVMLDETLVAERAHQKTTTRSRLLCFESGFTTPERLRTEIVDANHAGTASRFLIEYVAASPPAGASRISKSTYDRLLALSAAITSYGMTSDSLQYGIADRPLELTPAGRLKIADSDYEAGLYQYRQVFLDSVINPVVRPDQNSTVQRDELEAATKEEFGLSLSECLDFLNHVRLMGESFPWQLGVCGLIEFRARIAAVLEWNSERVDTAMNLFLLQRRDNFLKPSAPFRAEDVYPWRFNRELSYARRPLIVIDKESPQVIWGTRHIHLAAQYLIGLCDGGRLKATSDRMTRFLGASRKRSGESFNDQVADLISSRFPKTVRRRVKKIGSERISRRSGDDLGDIDVMLADVNQKVLFLCETKCFEVARTPCEIANEVKELFGETSNSKSTISKHLERTTWVTERLAETLRLFRDSVDAAEPWQVQPILIIDQPLISPFFKSPPFPVFNWRDVVAMVGNQDVRMFDADWSA